MPHRKLGNQHNLSGKQVFLKVKRELEALPDNTKLTKELCDPSRFSGILIIDGKYVKVKGFESKIPFFYGIDYLTHDPLSGSLYPAEDELAFSLFFEDLRRLNYPLRLVVADDRAGLKNALTKVLPLRPLQLCHTHYLENIRKRLNIRSSHEYLHFFNSLNLNVFKRPRTEAEVLRGLRYVWRRHARENRLLANIILDIRDRRSELFYYLKQPDYPRTTNLIESYNSHLNGRLKTIKGFQSFQSARCWLNAYLIRRRTKELTDCKGKFKHLNKHCSLELTIQKQAQWPDTLTNLGIKKINYFEGKKH